MEQAAQKGLNDALLDRLRLTEKTIDAMCEGLRQIASLPDPVGEMDEFRTRENGLQIGKMRVPLGVVGIIYESRPNVTVDAAALCLKSGNACVLRGGSEAFNSNMALSKLITQALVENGLSAAAVSLIENTDRESVGAMLQSPEFIDVVIPRGGKSLVSRIAAEARVPVIKHLDGICHVYIDRDADLDQAITILLNSKTRRCSVCNAAETVLIDTHLSDENKLSIITALQDAGVTIHGDPEELAAFGDTAIVSATNTDWTDEYLSMDIAARIVDGIDGALDHIRRYSSGHTEAICTTNITTAQRFADEVDSAAVMINASTAFTDGEQYGMGAEIGISTQKLHARGPMALPELTSTKWILHGTGQTRP